MVCLFLNAKLSECNSARVRGREMKKKKKMSREDPVSILVVHLSPRRGGDRRRKRDRHSKRQTERRRCRGG